MGLRGPAGKPIEEHVAGGTYRSDRHAFTVPEATGTPSKPEGLDGVPGALWDYLIPQLVEAGVTGSLDSTMLAAMCNFYGLYLEARKEAEQAPCDKDARIATVAYWGAFAAIAAKFGLTPSDRLRLKLPVPAEESDSDDFEL